MNDMDSNIIETYKQKQILFLVKKNYKKSEIMIFTPSKKRKREIRKALQSGWKRYELVLLSFNFDGTNQELYLFSTRNNGIVKMKYNVSSIDDKDTKFGKILSIKVK